MGFDEWGELNRLKDGEILPSFLLSLLRFSFSFSFLFLFLSFFSSSSIPNLFKKTTLHYSTSRISILILPSLRSTRYGEHRVSLASM